MSVIWLTAASFTRPADTTAYSLGDLVANSTTAGSVVPMTLTIRPEARGNVIRRCRIKKSGTSTTNAQFRVHFYESSAITFANGDNGAWSTNNVANYVGAMDVTVDRAFTDGAAGMGVPITGSEMNYDIGVIYAVIEARGAYTPASAETFTVEIEVIRA